jgi:hypothetical protein
MHPDAKPFSDIVPPLLEKKYLKTIFFCQECNGTIDALDEHNDIDVFKIVIF